jgi:hypothetical protein
VKGSDRDELTWGIATGEPSFELAPCAYQTRVIALSQDHVCVIDRLMDLLDANMEGVESSSLDDRGAEGEDGFETRKMGRTPWQQCHRHIDSRGVVGRRTSSCSLTPSHPHDHTPCSNSSSTCFHAPPSNSYP